MTQERSGQFGIGDKEIIFNRASEVFGKVRDIPYILGLDGNPNRLLVENVGNCTRKHLYLLPRLQALGYKVTVGIAEFDWRELPIPIEITNLLKDPIDTHLFLYASLDGNETVVDATWDFGMPQGFPVNAWDGYNSTQIGVSPIKIHRENYQVLKARALASAARRSIRQDRKPTPFNHAFNNWLHRG